MTSLRSFRRFIQQHTQDRALLGVPPLPLELPQVQELCSILERNEYDTKDHAFLHHHLSERIIPGVDETSQHKAHFLHRVIQNDFPCDLLLPTQAVRMLGTMQGGYNVSILTQLLDDPIFQYDAYLQLKDTLLIFDAFHEIKDKYKQGNPYAEKLLYSWSQGEWFQKRPDVKNKITLTVFKVPGETNTDDLSPAQDAWSRPDIPLHAQSMLKTPRPGIVPDKEYEVGPMHLIDTLVQKGHPIAYVGDVVGTGSSRKSATNSILWHFGNDIPHVPNKRSGGYCFGSKIAPIFFNTMEDSGAFPIEMDVQSLETGQVIDIYPYQGVTKDHETGETLCEWSLKQDTILDSVKAGGRIQLIIGKSLTTKAQQALDDTNTTSLFISNPTQEPAPHQKYTLAQKMVGKACNLPGILPGSYCEPLVTSVGSQDTTGPMTRDELKDLACLGFSADLVMQSFCHTAAYPKPVDIVTHKTLPTFMHNRGGISLKPGDGIIHSWLNRMLLPDTIGTGGDSHTRFPIGMSFPAGSGLVAFAAATGTMPLDMPESVLVRFHGTMQPGITLRDLVHAIPYVAKQKGLLTIEKKNKKNIFSGNILEIEGLPDLTCEQAFELSDATAERSAAGCTIQLNKEPVIEYLESNIALLEWMIREGYQDQRTIRRRIDEMKKWLEAPTLMKADEGASYKEIIDIDLNEIKEPILCAPNDPDDAVLLSEVAGESIDEVFIGSCMTNIGHFRATGELLQEYKEDTLKTKLWLAPPTQMDERILKEEGFYDIYEKVGVRTEMPGCSLCMGNQARVEDNATVLSTSTRNFPNRLGKGANVYLASAELSAISAIEGRIPTPEVYQEKMKPIRDKEDKIFHYMNFHQMDQFAK